MKSLASGFLCFLLLATAAVAQTPVLEPGRTYADVLAAGDTSAYELELPADWFVSGRVYKDGVDAAVTITGPGGGRVARFASPVGVGGPEAFRFATEAAGRYRIEVAGRGEAAAGAYRIRLERAEPVATTPEGRVDQAMTFFAEDTPGAVVAVLRDGRVEFVRSYGSAHLSHGIPFTERTLTNIGSTSKQFTGFALALLHVRGALSLEDEVRKHIPELPDFGHPITVRNLLSHTTGFREIFNMLLLGGRRVMEGDYISRDEVIEVIQRQAELQNVPGTEYNYNNTAFGLATIVVERVTGRPFGDWMRDEVFTPLGMYDTMVRAHAGQIVPRSSLGYTPGDGGFREARDLSAAVGAGAVYTTPVDLAKWMDNFRTGALGGPDVIRELSTPNVLSNGRSTNYGLGLQIGATRGLTRWQHGGADVAHRSTFVYFPELNAGYVVLSNYSAVPSVGNLVAEAFFGSHMQPVAAQASQAAATQVSGTAAAGDEDAEAGDAAAVDLTEFVGRYFSEELEAFYELSVDEGRLVLSNRRVGQVRLTHAEGDVFTGGMPVTRVEFERDERGRVTALRAGNGRARDLRFERLGR